ncbi:MAG: hypothetical protein H6681_00275 [Desulfobacteraceae bacterium]|nr:hypothetical protein [Desulfobacteraceae bacterium]
MLEAIGIKLITVLAGFLFEHGLVSIDKIQVAGAPSWYYEESNNDYLYVFSYKDGGIETIEPLKMDLEIMMEKRIEDIIEIVIYQNFRDVKDPKEKELVRQFGKDPNLSLFVKSNIKYERIVQQDMREKGLIFKGRPERTFGSAVLSKKALLDYQEERITILREQIVREQSSKMFDKLGSELGEDENEMEMEDELPKW